MKKHVTLKRMIIALSAVAATVVGCIFLIMYSQREIDESPDGTPDSAAESGAAKTPALITPKSFCSCGELMFAYIGKGGYLYNLDDESKPLIEQPADELLYASDDTVIYTAPAETDGARNGVGIATDDRNETGYLASDRRHWNVDLGNGHEVDKLDERLAVKDSNNSVLTRGRSDVVPAFVDQRFRNFRDYVSLLFTCPDWFQQTSNNLVHSFLTYLSGGHIGQ